MADTTASGITAGTRAATLSTEPSDGSAGRSSDAPATDTFDATLMDMAAPVSTDSSMLDNAAEIAVPVADPGAGLADTARASQADLSSGVTGTDPASAAQLLGMLGLLPCDAQTSASTVPLPLSPGVQEAVGTCQSEQFSGMTEESERGLVKRSGRGGNFSGHVLPALLALNPAQAPESELAVQVTAGSVAEAVNTQTLLPTLLSRHHSPEDKGGYQQATTPNMATTLQALSDGLALPRSLPPAPVQIDAVVGSKAWPEQLGNAITWMIDRGEQIATLRLSPDHLGPLEIHIAVRESEATVWFGASHPDTRAAIEQALPRLRDLLASSGIALAQAGVSGDPSRQPPRASPQGGSRPAETNNDEVRPAAVTAIRGGALLDVYA